MSSDKRKVAITVLVYRLALQRVSECICSCTALHMHRADGAARLQLNRRQLPHGCCSERVRIPHHHHHHHHPQTFIINNVPSSFPQAHAVAEIVHRKLDQCYRPCTDCPSGKDPLRCLPLFDFVSFSLQFRTAIGLCSTTGS